MPSADNICKQFGPRSDQRKGGPELVQTVCNSNDFREKIKCNNFGGKVQQKTKEKYLKKTHHAKGSKYNL